MTTIITHWPTLLAVAVFLALLPGLFIFAVCGYAAHSKLPDQLAKTAELPEEERAKLSAYIAQTRSVVGSFKFLLVEALTPYVLLIALPFTKWEAENLPKPFWRWDNEISLNGDRGTWVHDPALGKGVMLPVPLEDTPAARLMCYWLKDAHPRSFRARFAWLMRNRASKYAFMLGPEATAELKVFAQAWGDPDTNNGHEGTLVRRMGNHYEIYNIRKYGFFCRRTRYGCKIGNAILHGADRAMLVGIGVSYQKWGS